MGKKKDNKVTGQAVKFAEKMAKLDVKISGLQAEITALESEKRQLKAEYDKIVKPQAVRPVQKGGNAGPAKK